MNQTKRNYQVRAGRVPLLLMGIACLVCGIWGGLVRLPLILPLPAKGANWITFHGPLMVCGFLGTVIALERAVGLRSAWTYAAPALTGLGAVMLALGYLGKPPVVMITLGSALFSVVAWRVVQLQKALFTAVMGVAALAWLCGNLLWWQGWNFNRIVPWWIAFLALTIVGERLDLSRFQKPSKWSSPLLFCAFGIFGAGVVLSVWRAAAGERLVGAGMLALAAWLSRFDLARRTVRQPGLPRFMAVCLLSGYVWLAFSGALMVLFAPLETGLRYDAILHAFFVGFVFSMIFGHAPVIFPAVLVLQPVFNRVFYSHVGLLHLALALRLLGDLTGWAQVRQWGAIGNAVAVAVFLLNTIGSFVLRPRAAPTRAARR